MQVSENTGSFAKGRNDAFLRFSEWSTMVLLGLGPEEVSTEDATSIYGGIPSSEVGRFLDGSTEGQVLGELLYSLPLRDEVIMGIMNKVEPGTASALIERAALVAGATTAGTRVRVSSVILRRIKAAGR